MNFHDKLFHMKAKKFATQMDEKVLKDLKAYATAADLKISKVVTEAVREYLQKAHVRPAFREAMSEVLDEHSELLSRLAK